MEVNLIYRELSGDKHFLCWDKAKCEAAWIAEDMLERLKPRFQVVSFKTRELAEDRAKRFTVNGKVLTKDI